MRIRTIKPEYFTHEGLFELEKDTGLPIRVAFAGLWCVADKSGRFKWEPRRIGVSILPYDEIDFSRVLDALFTRGFIQRYRVESVDYGVIPSFHKHQFLNNKEKESDLPSPLDERVTYATATREPRVSHASVEPVVADGEDAVKSSTADERNATVTRAPRVDDAKATRAIGKGREGIKGKDIVASSPLASIIGFSEEWQHFLSHRKNAKKPLTERAMELTLGKLEQRPNDATAALQMVIEKGWQSIEWEWFDKNRRSGPSTASPGTAHNGQNIPMPDQAAMEWSRQQAATEPQETGIERLKRLNMEAAEQ